MTGRHGISAWVVGLAIVLAGTAGCSSNTNNVSLTAPPDTGVVSSTAPVTSPTPTSMRASTSSPSVAQTTSPAITTTVAAPPSSTSPPTDPPSTQSADVETQVRAAVDGYADAWRTCMRSLPSCDTSLLAETRTGDQLVLAQTSAQASNDAGYVARNVDNFQVTIKSVAVRSDQIVATVGVCIEDGITRVIPTATGDQVADDNFVSTKGVLAVALGDDGIWRVASSAVIDQATGQESNLCA